MIKGYRWVIAVLAVALLVVGCGPEMVTPTPKVQDSAERVTPTAEEEEASPATEPASPGELATDPDDWRSMGSADAPVTIVEYSDFQ
jgi:protein-disulfide isomerase